MPTYIVHQQYFAPMPTRGYGPVARQLMWSDHAPHITELEPAMPVPQQPTPPPDLSDDGEDVEMDVATYPTIEEMQTAELREESPILEVKEEPYNDSYDDNDETGYDEPQQSPVVSTSLSICRNTSDAFRSPTETGIHQGTTGRGEVDCD